MFYRTSFGVLLGFVAVSAGASATTLFSQTTANPTRGAWSSNSEGAATSIVTPGQTIAQNFMVSGAGAFIETVRWVGAGATGGAQDGVSGVPGDFVESFSITIFGAGSDGSQPFGGVGAALYTETFSLGSLSTTAYDGAFHHHEANLSTAFAALDSTVYWISIRASMIDTTDGTGWAWASDADGGDYALGYFSDFGPDWLAFQGGPGDEDFNMHFELLGTVIPLPSVAGLSALGLLAVGGTRRRKIA